MSEITRLRANCLNFWEVLAQSIALISPTMTAALIVPLMFSNAGNAGWLAYAFGAVMLLFVALNLNQFARRTTETGSMFGYTITGLGPTAGALAGWCLIWAYVFIGTAGMTGFTVFAQQLLQMAGLDFPAIPLFAICATICWALAYKDIRLSAVLMLVLEVISVALISVLVLVALAAHGFVPDMKQVTLSGSSFSGLALGVVVAIFSQVGFEAATAFGAEAKNPLRTIPRAVIVSLVLTGVFFVIVTYTETMALANAKPTLDKQTAPLATLSAMLHMGYFSAPIAAGAMISFFSLALSCMNSGARIIFAMSGKGVFHDSFGRSHESNATPHVAVTVMAALQFMIPTAMILGGVAVGDAFNDAGTFGAFGFCAAYFFISVAAPMYLKRIGELTAGAVALSVAAVALLLVPAIGSVYPVPPPPVNLFPYLFLAYFAIGFVGFVLVKPKRAEHVRSSSMLLTREMVDDVA